MMPDDAYDDFGQRPAAAYRDAAEDDNHLRLLSIFHYVVAGITALFGCFPFIHLTLGIAMLTGALPQNRPGDQEAMTFIGGMFVVIAAIIIACLWTLAAAMFFAARMLAAHRHYTYCLVVAAIECLLMPFGTVLGVFTLIVLTRPSVKADFGQ